MSAVLKPTYSRSESIDLFQQLLTQPDGKRFSLEAFDHSLEYACNIYFNEISEISDNIGKVEAIWGTGLELEVWSLTDHETGEEFPNIESKYTAKKVIEYIQNGISAETLHHWEIVIKESEDKTVNWDNVQEWTEQKFSGECNDPIDYAQNLYAEIYNGILDDHILSNFINWESLGNYLIQTYDGECIDGKLYSNN